VAELQALLMVERASFTQRITDLEKERDNLRASHERLRQELELFKRRLFIAKAERVDTKQLEIEFAAKLRELDAIAGTLGIAKDSHSHHDGADSGDQARDGKPRGKRKTTAARVDATFASCRLKRSASRSLTRTWRNLSRRARSCVTVSMSPTSSRTSVADGGVWLLRVLATRLSMRKATRM
jgi:hypothetical protein